MIQMWLFKKKKKRHQNIKGPVCKHRAEHTALLSANCGRNCNMDTMLFSKLVGVAISKDRSLWQWIRKVTQMTALHSLSELKAAILTTFIVMGWIEGRQWLPPLTSVMLSGSGWMTFLVNYLIITGGLQAVIMTTFIGSIGHEEVTWVSSSSVSMYIYMSKWIIASCS